MAMPGGRRRGGGGRGGRGRGRGRDQPPDVFALGGEERLQKFLSHAGLDSRRQCEQMILDGRVRVNGKMVTELGFKVCFVGVLGVGRRLRGYSTPALWIFCVFVDAKRVACLAICSAQVVKDR